MSDSAVTPAGVRDGEPDALRGLVARRGPAVLAYCAAVCEPTIAPRAAAEAFARFRGAVAAAVEPGALAPEPLLLGATRHAAASVARIAPAPTAGLRRLLGDRGANETCAVVPTLLAAQADGMLSPDDQDRLRRHLDRHPACREIEAGFRTAEQRYATPPERAIPPAVERLVLTALVAAAPLAPGVDASGILATGLTEEEAAVAAAQETQDWAAADVAAALAAADAAVTVPTGADPEPLADDEPVEAQPGPDDTVVVVSDPQEPAADEPPATDLAGLPGDEPHGPTRAVAPVDAGLPGDDALEATGGAAPVDAGPPDDEPRPPDDHDDDATTVFAPVGGASLLADPPPHPDAATVAPDEGFDDDDELVPDEDDEPATAVHAAVPAEQRSLRERLHLPDEHDHGPFFRFVLPGAAIVVALLIAAIVAGVFDGDDAEPPPEGAAPATQTVEPASAAVEPSALDAPEADEDRPVTAVKPKPRAKTRKPARTTATTGAPPAQTTAVAPPPQVATPPPAAPRPPTRKRRATTPRKDVERTEASPSLPGATTPTTPSDPADEPVFTPGESQPPAP